MREIKHPVRDFYWGHSMAQLPRNIAFHLQDARQRLSIRGPVPSMFDKEVCLIGPAAFRCRCEVYCAMNDPCSERTGSLSREA
jgi:hypothetical protein